MNPFPVVMVGAVLIGVLVIVATVAGIGKYRYDKKYRAEVIANEDTIAYAVKTKAKKSTAAHKEKKKKKKKKKTSKASKESNSTETWEMP